MERIYIICYNIYEACGGSFKYAMHPRFEARTEFFTKQERDDFIARYLHLSEQNQEIYIGELKCFTAIPELIQDMGIILNAI